MTDLCLKVLFLVQLAQSRQFQSSMLFIVQMHGFQVAYVTEYV